MTKKLESAMSLEFFKEFLQPTVELVSHYEDLIRLPEYCEGICSFSSTMDHWTGNTEEYSMWMLLPNEKSISYAWRRNREEYITTDKRNLGIEFYGKPDNYLTRALLADPRCIEKIVTEVMEAINYSRWGAEMTPEFFKELMNPIVEEMESLGHSCFFRSNTCHLDVFLKVGDDYEDRILLWTASDRHPSRTNYDRVCLAEFKLGRTSGLPTIYDIADPGWPDQVIEQITRGII